MTRNESAAIRLTGDDLQLIRLTDEVIEQLEAGQPFDLDEFLSVHPDHEQELRRLFPAIQALVGLGTDVDVADSSPSMGPVAVDRTLGDFRILRELGRGGMGVVYEAEQLSLGRRVALKVLPFAAMLDKRHLERFKNEARAAAVLKHPHIVSVYSVGHDRGVHFYAMELVEGESLARVIEQLTDACGEASISPSVDTSTNTQPIAALSTDYSRNRPAYYQTIARWGIQIAEALDYAHQRGVVHRDIKPSNLLFDRDGKIWISDFGLAQIQDDHNLTMTGDVLGTLRYMSPEQAEGKKYIDHHTDIYSLGVTIYELLTLTSPFLGGTRQQLMRQVTEQQPDSLRQRDPGIPQDLDTIVLKAMAKRPDARFASAQELADDLQRYLDHKPIKARRTTRAQIAWRWACRNPLVAILLSTVLTLLLLLSIGGPTVAVKYARMNADNVALSEAAEAAREQALRQLYVSDIQSAQAAWEQGNIEHVRQLLLRHVPQPGANDLRGFEWRLLWGRCEAAMAAPTLKHANEIRALRFSPDGSIIASADNKTITLWDASTNKEIRTFQSAVRDIAFSPDGRILACATGDPVVRLWDVESRRTLATLPHTEETNAVAFSPDGKVLAVGTGHYERGDVTVWDASTYEELTTLSGDTGGIASVAFSPDGAILASGGRDRIVRLWDVASWQEIDTLVGHTYRVSKVTFSPDGGVLASLGLWGRVRLWNPGAKKLLITFGEPLNQVADLVYHPDGETVALAAQDGRVWFWDPTTQTCRRCPGSPGYVSSLAYSPNGETLVCGSRDGTIRFLKLETLDRSEDGHSDWWTSVAISPINDNLLAVASGEMVTRPRLGEVVMWDLPSGMGRLLTPPETTPFTIVVFSPDGSFFATGNESRRAAQIPSEVVLWNSTTGERLRRITSHESYTMGLAFSPDGSILASCELGFEPIRPPPGEWAGQVTLTDVATGKVLKTHRLDQFAATTVTFSPDAEQYAVGGGRADRGRVKMWSLRSNADPIALSGHPGVVYSVAFSPDGTRLASADWSGSVRIWNAADGTLIRTIVAHAKSIFSLAFAPDGRTLVSAGIDQTVKLWHLETGDELLFLRAEAPVSSLAFTANGKSLVAGCLDRSVKIWNVDGSEKVLRRRTGKSEKRL